MRPLLRLANALIKPQVRLRKAHALRRARYDIAVTVLAGLAGVFGLALITLLLVVAVGALWALAMETAFFALAAGVTYALLRAETRRQARETAQLTEVQKQELRAALSDAIPTTGGFGLAAAGVAMALAFLLARGADADDPDMPPAPDNREV